MKLLVTGVTGFLGGRVAAGLAERGHAVRGFVRDPARWTERPAGAEAVVGDVTDSVAVRRAIAGCEAVVHCAAMVKVWAKEKAEFDRINVGGLRNVLDAAAASGARVVYTSSFIALGPTDGATFDEETPRRPGPPHNDYERTKWAADRVAREASAAGARIVRLYPGVVYGPGSLTAGNHVVQNLLMHARGKLPGMLGAGDRRMSLAYTDDVVAGFASALERARDGSAYILGGDNRTLADLFEAFRAATGIAPPKRKIPYAVAGLIGHVQRWRAELLGIEPELTDQVVRIYAHEWAYSSKRAEADLGYRITPLAEGVAKTVAWLRARGELPAAA
ncbi:MAG TPA: NAD-dependent epimerase/dehydratase family protein [Candidatus Polarisedimenticolaceae bacterium]|nr:NAD-dependent epimerase/dehydratase family protein [Candidatus Polarisedimenticolaceae bacterium]